MSDTINIYLFTDIFYVDNYLLIALIMIAPVTMNVDESFHQNDLPKFSIY